jgi:predicted DNA-binding transcriptional regulator AlpA
MSSATPSSLDDVCRHLARIADLITTATRPPAELLTRDEMAALLNVGVSTFDKLKSAGKIGPRPLELAGVKYSAAEVRAWLAYRDAAGHLYDSQSWPPVWASLNRSKKH